MIDAGVILVTGGAGYVGAHVCAALARAGRRVAVFDSFATSDRGVVDRLARLVGPLPVIEGDVRDAAALDRAFADHPVSAVVHLAGLKVLSDSFLRPDLYHDVNVTGGARLYDAMARAGVRRLIFSSTAAVYAPGAASPIAEDAALAPASPYGATKLENERMLAARAAADPDWRIVRLRYFNPVGADPSGLIGEDPHGAPTNLFPLIAEAALGRRPGLVVHGADWPTRDGSGVRDFIHVADLAEGHVAALDWLERAPDAAGRAVSVNLGCGCGHSVLEALAAWRAETGLPIPAAPGPRRPGDLAEVYADPSLAARLFGWRATRGLAEMCRDHWRWARARA